MKKLAQEFKDFISRGNVLDMAVGVIIGSAFGKIVSSLVDNILMPLIGLIIGGHDFSSLAITVKDAKIEYGLFIQNVVDFLIVAFCIFMVIKAVNKLHEISEKKLKKQAIEEVKAEPVKSDEAILLEEIRDLLKKNK